MELHLEDNQFSGSVPLLVQPSLVSLNLSNNKLEGHIPSGMSRFTPSAFTGNQGLCGGNCVNACLLSLKSSNGPEPESKPRPGPMKIDRSTQKMVIGTSVVSALVFLLMIAGIVVLTRRQDKLDLVVDESPSFRATLSNVGKKDLGADRDREGFGSGHLAGSSRKSSKSFGKGDIVMINDEKGEFCLADLMKATAEVLGNGALGSTYKAMMANGLIVVVKRIKEMTTMGRDQFDAEMRRFGSLKHKNVLTPFAYHYRSNEKLLVYEYQPKGSLLFLLHGDREVSHVELNWPMRLRIVQGIARGLGYLHTELSSLDLPHGDLKSSNVLLTPENEPLLSDYGFYFLINGTQAAQALAAYRSPEAILHRHILPKCDVFCLGIIILEILTRKLPRQYLNNGEGGIHWARSAIAEGRHVDLLDPDIASTTNCIGDMEQLLHIGLACTQSSIDQRLDIREAIIRRIDGLVGEGIS